MVLSAGRKRSGGLDAGYNAGGAKKYEAAQDHHRTVPPVYPAREHQKTYRGDGDYSNHRCNGAEQRSLHTRAVLLDPGHVPCIHCIALTITPEPWGSIESSWA